MEFKRASDGAGGVSVRVTYLGSFRSRPRPARALGLAQVFQEALNNNDHPDPAILSKIGKTYAQTHDYKQAIQSAGFVHSGRSTDSLCQRGADHFCQQSY